MGISARGAQYGLTLIEGLASLSVASMVIYGMGSLSMDYLNNTEAVTAAQQLKTLGEAGRAYVVDNGGLVASRATTTNPCVITATELTGYAPGVAGSNSYGQNMVVLVAKNAAGALKTMAVSYGGSYTPTDGQLAMVSNALGGDGGVAFSFSPTEISGSGGSWTLDLTSGLGAAFRAAGVSCATGAPAPAINITTGSSAIAHWVADPSVGSQVLYRNPVPGRPELNAMNTPLVMNSVQTVNAVCTTPGAIARDGNGAIVSCQAGTWKSQGSLYWKDPVANFASLPATGDPVGAVRMTLDNNRGFVWTGGGWAALAVDQNGNLTVPGTLTAAGGRVVAWNQVAEGGVLQLVGANGTSVYLESQNGKFRLLNNPWNAELFSVDQGGNVVSRGTLYAAGRATVHTNDWGLVLRDGGGADNVQAQNGIGSAYVNDVYVRSAGKWASQIVSGGSLSCYYVAWGTYSGNGNGICGWAPGYQYIGPNASYLHGGFCCKIN